MPISDRYQSVTSRARLLALAPLTCLFLGQPLAAQGHSSLAQRELQRRAANTEEAQELLKKGDESYKAGKWADAASAFEGARGLLPDAPATAELRAAATQRFAQASVELARKQRRMGDAPSAIATVDKVLLPEVAPNDAAARQLREELNDPIRTEPAMSPELAKDIDEVRRLLYTADSAKNLGKFDEATMRYEDVLRIDPTNTAARRGMESVAQIRTDYYRAAYDQTRGAMLSEVDGAWELQVKPVVAPPSVVDPSDTGSGAGRILLGNKMERLVMPSVDFSQTPIQEALDYLRAQSVQLDTFEVDPARKGINFVLDLGGASPEVAKEITSKPISLQLKNVPMTQVLRYICDNTRTSYSVQQYAVVIRPAGAASAEMITRTYRVPPDFLTSGGGEAGGGGGDDPFGDGKADAGLKITKKDTVSRLRELGVEFPEGSSASFLPATSTIYVTNTGANHELIDQVVSTMANEQPRMVSVQVRMIRTQLRVLEELDFDWLLSDFPLGGKSIMQNIPATHLSGGTDNPENLADVAVPPGERNRRAITSGNRSGTEAIGSDAIDDLILEEQAGFSRGMARAPGILWGNGRLNNNNLTMLMRGLAQKKNVDLVVSPSTVTRSGQQSTVEVVREFIYPTEYEPPELPNTVDGGGDLIDLNTGNIVGNVQPPLVPITPATPTSFEMRPTGVTLDVLPTVSADGHYVDIALKPIVTDFQGFINYGTPITSPALGGGLDATSTVPLTDNKILMPVFSVMKADTNLTIRDGETIVFGGMLEEKVQKVQDKTQFFGDLPLVGRFFQNQAYQPVRTAVVFMVTVKVLDPTGESPHGR